MSLFLLGTEEFFLFYLEEELVSFGRNLNGSPNCQKLVNNIYDMVV